MERPLVSIVVFTYNSSKYILETLDSIKIQQYTNIELVVCDDCSKDETYSIVLSWLSLNEKRFKRAILIKSIRNMGTCYNYSLGVSNSTGVYIKTLDGDDCLNGIDAISCYVDFMENNNTQICISDVELFSEEGEDLSKERDWYDYILKCESEDLEHQKQRICKELSIADPGMFFTRELFDSVGGFSTNYKLLEEWPFFYSTIMSGHQIVVLSQRLVRYRINPKSVSHCNISPTFVQLQKDLARFFWKIRLKELLKSGKVVESIYEAIHTTKALFASIFRLYYNKVKSN